MRSPGIYVHDAHRTCRIKIKATVLQPLYQRFVPLRACFPHLNTDDGDWSDLEMDMVIKEDFRQVSKSNV